MKTAVDSSVLLDIVKGAPGAIAAQLALEAALAHTITQADALLTSDAGFYRHYFEGLQVLSP